MIEAGYFLGYDLKCGVSFNLVAVCIPAADKIWAKARKETNKAKRQAMWNQIAKLWNTQSPKIPVYGDKYTSVVNKRVKTYFYSHEIDFSGWSKQTARLGMGGSALEAAHPLSFRTRPNNREQENQSHGNAHRRRRRRHLHRPHLLRRRDR